MAVEFESYGLNLLKKRETETENTVSGKTITVFLFLTKTVTELLFSYFPWKRIPFLLKTAFRFRFPFVKHYVRYTLFFFVTIWTE